MGATLIGITFDCSASETYNQEKFRIDGEHTATYKIRTDDEDDREDVVITAPGCPYIGMPSTILPGARCIERQINEVAPRIWDVEATFSQNFISDPDEEDPWDRTPEWSWSFETVDEPLLYDAQDASKAIQNSAGEGLPPLTRPIAVPVLTISRYELNFNPEDILNYVNFVNSSVFWGAAAGKVLCAGINASQETYKEYDMWKVTYTFKFKMDTHGWTARILDQGSYYWTGTVGSSEKKPFSDDSLNPIVGNLNGSGGKNTTTTPSFVSYNRYDEVDFNDQNLGPWS